APWGKGYAPLMAGNGLFIGEVAARSGLSRKALRLYEARGILKAPRRTPSGYRHYDSDVLRLLTFVSQARRLGLTLTEIRHIVALRSPGYFLSMTTLSRPSSVFSPSPPPRRTPYIRVPATVQ